MTLGRRAFVGLLAAGLVPSNARAQTSGVAHRIGWLSAEAEPDPFLEGFREAANLDALLVAADRVIQ